MTIWADAKGGRAHVGTPHESLRDTTFVNQIGECRISFKAAGGRLLISRFLSVTRPVWPTAVYQDVKNLFHAFQAYGNMAVVVSMR